METVFWKVDRRDPPWRANGRYAHFSMSMLTPMRICYRRIDVERTCTNFTKLNNGWNAEPGAPYPELRVLSVSLRKEGGRTYF